jgi:hypothetical protein
MNTSANTTKAIKKRDAMRRFGAIVPVVLLETTRVLPHIIATTNSAKRDNHRTRSSFFIPINN